MENTTASTPVTTADTKLLVTEASSWGPVSDRKVSTWSNSPLSFSFSQERSRVSASRCS